LNFFLIFAIIFSLALLSIPIYDIDARGIDEPCSYLKPQEWTKDEAGNCIKIVNTPPVVEYTNPPVIEQRDYMAEHLATNSPAMVISASSQPVTTTNTETNQNFLPAFELSDIMKENGIEMLLVWTMIFGIIGSMFYIIGVMVNRLIKHWRNSRQSRIIGINRPIDREQVRSLQQSFNEWRNNDPDRLMVEFGATLKHYTKRGNELYETDKVIPGRNLKLLKYRDPSTNKIYVCFVPDEIENADDGMAWKFNISKSEYHNITAEG